MRKVFRKLSYKFTFGFIVLGLIISAVSGTIGYVKYKSTIEKQYNDNAYSIAAVAASYVDGDALEQYLETGTTDKAYDIMGKNLDKLRKNMGANYIYLAKLKGIELTYLYDADNPNDGYPPFQLGDTGKINPDFEKDALKILTIGERPNNYFYSHSQFGYNTSAIVPVYNREHQIVAIIGVEIAMSLIESTLREYIWVAVIFTTILIFLFVTLYLIYLNNKVISPLKLITQNAADFVKSNNQISDDILSVKTGDEIEKLANSLYKLEVDINQYINNLAKVTADKERIATELNVATQIQASMLPCIFPAFPDRAEFDVYATMLPAKEVGGDFYDFFLIGDTHLGVVIADVSGKGVPAALFMVIAKTLIKNHVQAGENPGDVFTNVNNQLCENNEADMFVTAWMGILEIKSGKITYVNAGHNPPLIEKANGGNEYLKSQPGFVLAGMENIIYHQNDIQLDSGDILFLYTDGVTEATNAQNELYGEGRLKNVLDQNLELPLERLLPEIKADIDIFVNGAEQADDITMLALKIR